MSKLVSKGRREGKRDYVRREVGSKGRRYGKKRIDEE